MYKKVKKQKHLVESLRSKLESAEKSGFTNDSKEQILATTKSSLNG